MVLIKLIDKNFPLLIPLMLMTGMLLGDLIVDFRVWVPWIFAFVTFIGALRIDFDSFKQTIKKPKPMIGVLSILRLFMPLWALLLGRFIFPGYIDTQIGLLLFALIPVGVNSVLWTVLHQGNVALTLSVVLLDTLLSPLLLPLSVLLLTGVPIRLETAGLMMSLLQMVVLPSLVGMMVNQLTKGVLFKKWHRKLIPVSKMGLLTVMMINGSTVRDDFTTVDLQWVGVMVSIVFLAVSGYTMSWYLAKLLKLGEADTKAVVFSGGMRNISAGIVIAVAYFPAAVAVPMVTGVFFQQMVCVTVAKWLKRHYHKAR